MQVLQMNLFYLFEVLIYRLMHGTNIIYIIAAFLSRGTGNKSVTYYRNDDPKNSSILTTVDMGLCFNFVRS